tara:strand:+ start:429 stop:3122 length:2694 start_codon:yes stop_codon:yes gene_type:complete
MVSFIKSKGTSFINRPVGVARVDTGSIQASEQLARTGQNLANSYFAEATKKEQEKGRDYVAQLPVRDEKGKLEFKPITGLSDVASATAEPLLRRKYGEALAVDMQQNIQKIRLKYKGKMNPDGFQDEARRYIGEYINTVKEQGGGDYTSFIQDGASKYIVQNYNDLALEKIDNERKISLVNSMKIIDESISDIESQMTNVPININDEDFKADFEFAETSIEMTIADIQDKISEGLSSSAALNATTKARNAPAIGLMKNVLRNKSAEEMLAIQNQYNLGSTNNVSNQNTIDYVNLIKQKYGDNKAITQIIARSVGDQNASESKATTIKNQQDKLTNEIYTDTKKSIESQKAGKLFQADIAEEASTVEPTVENINSLFSKIDNTLDTGVLKNIPNYGPVLSTRDEVNAMKGLVVDRVIGTLLQKNEVEITSVEYSNIKTKIAFPNKEVDLSDNAKKFIAEYNTINDAIRDPNFKGATIRSLSSKLQILKENNQQNKVTQARGRHNNQVVSGTYVHSEKGSEYINADLGLSDDYFLNGIHNESNEDFELIERSISEGRIPSSLVKGFRKVIDGTANEFQIQSMLGYYKRYSQQMRNGVMVSTLGNVLTKNQSAILESVSELYQQGVGLTEFAGIKGSSPTGQITLNQIVNRVKALQQMDSQEYTSKVKALNVKANDERYILRDFKFKPKEVNFFDTYTKILISNGEDLESIKEKVTAYKDQYFVDTQGQVVDPLYASNTTKSMHSLLRVIPNEADRDRFITYVNGTLPSNYILYDESYNPKRTSVDDLKNFTVTEEMSSKYAGQTFSSFKDTPTDLRPSLYRAVRQGLFEKKKVDKFAVLVPLEYGAVSMVQSGDYIAPTANIRYQAYEVKNNELVPIENEKGPIFYDVDNVLDTERPQE